MNVLRATMRSLDMTEDYMRFRAMNVEQPLPVREDFVTRTIRSRELARVNNNLIDLLKEHKKKFTFTGLLKQLVV